MGHDGANYHLDKRRKRPQPVPLNTKTRFCHDKDYINDTEKEETHDLLKTVDLQLWFILNVFFVKDLSLWSQTYYLISIIKYLSLGLKTHN